MAETVREYVVTVYGPSQKYDPDWCGSIRYEEYDVPIRAYTAADAITQASVSLNVGLRERVVRVSPREP